MKRPADCVVAEYNKYSPRDLRPLEVGSELNDILTKVKINKFGESVRPSQMGNFLADVYGYYAADRYDVFYKLAKRWQDIELAVDEFENELLIWIDSGEYAPYKPKGRIKQDFNLARAIWLDVTRAKLISTCQILSDDKAVDFVADSGNYPITSIKIYYKQFEKWLKENKAPVWFTVDSWLSYRQIKFDASFEFNKYVKRIDDRYSKRASNLLETASVDTTKVVALLDEYGVETTHELTEKVGDTQAYDLLHSLLDLESFGGVKIK